MKNFIFTFIAVLIVQVCYASEIYMELPSNFPNTLPACDNYVERAKTQVFIEKWANSILDNNNDINLKILDRSFVGVGVRNFEEFDYIPNISLTKNLNLLNCKLYCGVVNKKTYYKLNSPILFDSKHNVCVAVIGWRNYCKTSSPCFEEPTNFEQIVYVLGNLPQTETEPFDLKEIILLPSNIKNKKHEKKYIKEVTKLYNSSTGAMINKNSFTKGFGDFMAFTILLPLAILGVR